MNKRAGNCKRICRFQRASCSGLVDDTALTMRSRNSHGEGNAYLFDQVNLDFS